MKRRTNTGGYSSELYCTECGRKGIPIPRRRGQDREAGHLKNLYCIYCKKETNHAEVRPFGDYNREDFEKEFELGRFVDGQKTPIAELMSCSKTHCKYNQSGKCWNSNYSFDCGHRIMLENKQIIEKLGKKEETNHLLNHGW